MVALSKSKYRQTLEVLKSSGLEDTAETKMRAACADSEPYFDVELLDLDRKTLNVLHNNDIRTLYALVTRSRSSLRRLNMFGPTSMRALEDVLAKYELKPAMTIGEIRNWIKKRLGGLEP